MNKLNQALSPEVAKKILESYSVPRNRTAFWFFKEDLEKSLKSTGQKKAIVDQASENEKPFSIIKKPRQSEITQLWREMKPEAKRKYFNEAKFDEVRYKEQKALWVAEVGSFIARHGNQEDKLVEAFSSAEKNQETVLESLEKYRGNIEHMIQTQSTKNLYKDVIAKIDKINLCNESMISAIPEDLRPLLERPRRPPPAYILYTIDQREHLYELQRTEFKNMRLQKIASHMWSNMSQEERQKYEDLYSHLLEKYNTAKEKFEKGLVEKSGIYLDQASKEKRAIAVSLRRKLKTFALVPLNVRNAFNFFLIHNKNVSLSELTKTWRNLPETEKLKYKEMYFKDTDRYYREKRHYDEIMDTITDLIKKSKKKYF